MRSPLARILTLCLLWAGAARSQSGELMVQGQTGKLYLVHSVAAKENWYSIGRMYNESPKAISAFNKLAMDKPLGIGQEIQIPLTPLNFSQNEQKTAAESLVPVYYVVGEKEWLYRISVNHNKVPIPALEKWNHIGKEGVRPGMHVIVGYLKVKTALSALANGHAAPAASGASPQAPTATAAASRSESTLITPQKPDTPAQHADMAATSSVQYTAPATALHFNGGSFRADFYDGGRTSSGMAGTFKSTSGWQDGKYYALMNNVPVGTIVRVTDAANSKSIFAKVLGQLPDMRESAGLTIRISNAAASELGVGDTHFNVELHY